jgi:VCBS repeat-containing protein
VTDEKGGFDFKEVAIIITGTNDEPVISAGNVQEEAKLTASGQFTFADVNVLLGEPIWRIDAPSDDYGSMAVDSKTGKWIYTLNNSEKVNSLAADESLEKIYTITATLGVSVDTEDVTIIISGKNDKPVISVMDGQVLGNVQEEAILSTSGQFISSDADF